MALLTEGDVLKLIPVSKQTLKDWEREGIFPKSNGEEGRIIPYRLKPIDMGKDEDGEPITTCVVE